MRLESGADRPSQSFARSELAWHYMDSAALPAVLRIERNAQRIPWGRLAFEESITRAEADRPLALSNGGYTCDVLQANKLIVGFVIVSSVLDELHILNLAVSPEYQGLGLGHLLVERCIHIAEERSCERVFLEVRKSNVVAQSLYLKWQFQQLAVRRDYYRNVDNKREDAVVMVRQLVNTVST